MNRVFIIAEAGVNHNGSLDMAKQLIDIAVEAGVDYVKFQTFKSENVISRKAQKAEYQIHNTRDANESQLEMVKKLEFNEEQHRRLIAHCKLKNIKFLSTPFDLDSINLLEKFNLDFFKIPSGEITNLPYLKKIASINKPVVLSTGMCYLGEIEWAINQLITYGLTRDMITVLHCNTEYPTPIEDVNLSAMLSIRESLKTRVGYSDHTLGIEVPIAAVAMGAVLIEKHFTISRALEGPDHPASLEPFELKEMVRAIRNIEKAIGDGIKRPSSSEIKNIAIARKSIHYSKNLKKGQVLTENDLVMKRPGIGVSPMFVENFIGRKLICDVSEEDMLRFSDFN
ncbi:N-acetylneuraminate synthase [Leptospira weilii]|uniref:N-acetylneuraminate synthase n=1 Tax=Leptospira weilii TaxID=28184 RepID=UPI000774308A|nr:N-acetylneuraminate synthase [Leptospira weilii]